MPVPPPIERVWVLINNIAVRHVYLLAILPIMTYAAHALHLTGRGIKTMEPTHGNIIKASLGLSKGVIDLTLPEEELALPVAE